jgi:crotonobetainyl-CoA:carnitine CoA-transferase CaiB-like acyl-CoA transferase
VRLGETPAGACRRAPALGEHTREVLEELGFAAPEISDFRNQGVI